jgi:hypothetical protein
VSGGLSIRPTDRGTDHQWPGRWTVPGRAAACGADGRLTGGRETGGRAKLRVGAAGRGIARGVAGRAKFRGAADGCGTLGLAKLPVDGCGTLGLAKLREADGTLGARGIDAAGRGVGGR